MSKAQSYILTGREHATVLAALRHWQREGLMSGGHEQGIAGNDGAFDPLTAGEIDRLCENLNIPPKINSLCEVVADMALNMGVARDGVKPDDSRRLVADLIGWAMEFEDRHKDTDWSEHGDYIGSVDEFFVAKFEDSYGAHPFKPEIPKQSVEYSIISDLRKSLHYLLEQTVDMDLKHGIELTEGEADARKQALAAIARAERGGGHAE